MATCSFCGGEMLSVTGCNQRQYTIAGMKYPSVTADPHGTECHDCGALEDEPHHPGCDMETCPHCGGQMISCEHGREAFASLEESEQ